MSDLHQATFKFPAGPSKVVITGTFDNWSRSTLMTKTSTCFEITLNVPWGAKTTYKYIVDGHWFASPTEPQEEDGNRNINNYYISPPKPSQPAAKPAPPAAAEQPKTTLQQIKDSVIAADGAPTLTSYVASGLGAAVATVAGYDPINPQHIPVEETQKESESAKIVSGTEPAPTVETVSEPVHVNGDVTIPKPTTEKEEEVAGPAIIPPAVSATVAEVAEKVESTVSNEPEPAPAPAPIPIPNAPEPYPAVNGKKMTTTHHPEEPPTVVISTEEDKDEKIVTKSEDVHAKEEKEETTPPAPKSETKEITPRNSTASPPRASNVTPPTTPRKKGFPSDTASSITDSPSKRKKRLSFFGKIKEVLTPEKKHKKTASTSS